MNGSIGNGMVHPNNYGGYPDPSSAYAPVQPQQPQQSQQQYYQPGREPQIYTAVYSNVSVFEMEVNGVAVMRRRADSWLNATQILKVAGVDKGKRTKVLEKEILSGEHEKVQGGYGKYQGTWINYQRGREFCRQYGVEHLLLPLLEYDVGNDGTSGQPPGMETPTKEQAMAAQRKRMYGADGRTMSQSSSGTYFKNMSNTAANAIQALNRTRMDSPNHMDGRKSIGPRRPSQQHFAPESTFPNGSQQSIQSLSQDSFSNGAMLSQGASFADFPNTESQEPPRKRIRPSPQASFNTAYDGHLDFPMQDGSPTEPNQSFFSQTNQSFVMGQAPAVQFGLEPLPHPSSPNDERKKELLLDLFIDPGRVDFDDHPAFLQLSGDDFELPIDASCNTALHWASTLARIALVKKLLDRGFNMRRANSGGETALIAACQARNNLDQSSFSALLDLLSASIEMRDGRGRSLLHHIAVSSAMKGRAAVGKYYLESLLEHVVRQGSMSHPPSFNGMNGDSQTSPAPMTLARFMAEVVNAQDKSGDTALNLAARTSTTSIIDQLIEVGADAQIANRGGLAPVDFGVGNEGNHVQQGQSMNVFDVALAETSSSQRSFEQAQQSFMSCKSDVDRCRLELTDAAIQQMLTQSDADFQAELKEKNETLDKTNAALKESGSSLAEERKRLDELRSRRRKKDELTQKISNLRRGAEALRSEMAKSQPSSPVIKDHVAVGEADKGLDFGGQIGMVDHLFPGGMADPSRPLDQDQVNLLSVLERSEVLSGRAKAYQIHNQGLENHAQELKARSSELEERYKKIVSLCTGADVERVDELLDGLVQAVISEQKEMGGDNELGRVRDFLRMVNET